MTDLLSPDSSPQKLTGVKRVNNIPLMIVMGVLIVFVVLIALVAHKRAHAHNEMPEKVRIESPKKSTMNLAYELVENHKAPVIEAKPIVYDPSPALMPQKEEIVLDTENERIRQVKAQDFEEAVKAKTSVLIDNPRLKENSNGPDSPQPQLLQDSPNPMPQALGGEENEMRWHLNSKLWSPNSPFELRTGAVIPGAMISGINSELPGQIIGQVSQNVYDTATGKHLLIPQGTKLIGLYSSDVGFGQNSILVAWQRLIFPDGKALDIGSMPGADSAGLAGFRDKVNHHYARLYGSAILMSGIVAGITYSQNNNQTNQFGYNQPTAGSVISQALGQQLGEATSQLVAKNLSISPTINIRPGYRFNIIVVKDLTFNQPYREFEYET